MIGQTIKDMVEDRRILKPRYYKNYTLFIIKSSADKPNADRPYNGFLVRGRKKNLLRSVYNYRNVLKELYFYPSTKSIEKEFKRLVNKLERGEKLSIYFNFYGKNWD